MVKRSHFFHLTITGHNKLRNMPIFAILISTLETVSTLSIYFTALIKELDKNQ
jgi:hypothetical protein